MATDITVVAGATGALGGAVSRRLLERGTPVRAIVRASSDAGKVAELRRLGAETVEADLKDPASLAAACAGATAVASTVTAIFPRAPGDSIETVDRDGQLALVDAARDAGVERFVYVSYSRQIDTPCPLTDAKRAVEEHLRASGLAVTILRPSAFMEAWLGPAFGFDLVAGRVRVLGDGDAKVSWIALDDVAQAVVAALETDAVRGATIELGGPDALSALGVVRMAEEIGGRRIDVELVPVDAIEQQRAAATAETDVSVASLMLDIARGDAIDAAPAVEALSLQLTSVRDYVATQLG